MDVSSAAGMATRLSNTKLADQVDLAVLNKALDMQVTQAAGMIEMLNESASANLPDNLGQNINTKA